MKTLYMTAAAAALLATTPAIAKHQGHDMEQKLDAKAQYYFTKMDTNQDKMISQDEAMAYSKKAFAEADKNGDGNISMDEKKAHLRHKMQDMHSHMPKKKHHKGQHDAETLHEKHEHHMTH